MEYVKSYRELEVYKVSRQLSKEIFEISRQFPKEEMYSLTDQIRRSSRSVGAQIAEAWAKRRYEKHFISKLTDADGEQQETQHWLEVASDCAYLSAKLSKEYVTRYASVGRMLNSMIKKSGMFCGEQNKATKPPTFLPKHRSPITEYPITDY
jgi:four helix bundle protein